MHNKKTEIKSSANFSDILNATLVPSPCIPPAQISFRRGRRLGLVVPSEHHICHQSGGMVRTLKRRDVHFLHSWNEQLDHQDQGRGLHV